jgi:hypothetical protein
MHLQDLLSFGKVFPYFLPGKRDKIPQRMHAERLKACRVLLPERLWYLPVIPGPPDTLGSVAVGKIFRSGCLACHFPRQPPSYPSNGPMMATEHHPAARMRDISIGEVPSKEFASSRSADARQIRSIAKKKPGRSRASCHILVAREGFEPPTLRV